MKKKRFLTILLSLMLIVTSFTANPVIAENEETVDETVETVQDQQSEQKDEVTETVTDISDEQQTTEAEELPVEQDIDIEEESQDITQDILMPAQQFSADSSSGVHVEASVGEGVLPADTKLYVQDINEKRAKSIAENAVDENVTVADAIAVDISFRDKNFRDIEPADGTVSVTITLNKPLEGEELKVIHKENNGDVSVLDHTELSEETVAFDTESFSIYVVAVVEQTQPRLEVRFFMPEASEPYNTQYVASGDDLHDPGIVESEMDADDIFAGWSVNGTEYATIDGVKGLVPSSITAGSSMDVTAVIHVERRLVYERLDGIIIKSEDVITSNDSATFTVNQSYTASSGSLGFVGWTYSNNIESVDAETGEVTLVDSSLIFRNGSTLTVTEPETVLKPVVLAGHWLTFDENDGGYGGGASFTAPVFYLTTETTAEPEAPTRAGYDFVGWFTAAEGGTQFAFNTTINEDKTLYAHWTPKSDTTYTVVIWQQKVSDDKDAADSEKTYSYLESHQVSAATGATIQASDLSTYTGYNFTGFDYRTYEIKDGNGNTTTTVGAKGDTVVNVYYDRELWEISFFEPTTDNYNTTPDQYGKHSSNATNAFVKLTHTGAGTGGRWQRNGSTYTSTRYKITNQFTGLYGQPLDMYGYEWPTGSWNNISFVSAFEGSLFGNSGLGNQAGKIHTSPTSSTPNVTIINYLQDPENPDEYIQGYISQYYFNSNSNRYRLTDRFQGYEVSGYKWSTSDSRPTDWDTNISGGFTGNTKGDNTGSLKLNVVKRG